jgi:uncharacterized membrane protein YcaP (DUF421 family)
MTNGNGKWEMEGIIMELYKILLRVVFAYIFILFLLRLSGKREVAQATGFDFVLALILGDLFDDLIWAEVPASQFVVAAGTLVLLHTVIALGSRMSEAFSRIICSQAEVFMSYGRLIWPAMQREQINEKDAEMLLRQHSGLARERWVEVESARIEQNGKPSVLRHEWAREAQKKDRDSLLEVKQ